MKKRLVASATFALATLQLATVVPAHASMLSSTTILPAPNLLVDGGFEQPAIAAGSYATFTAIPGWVGAPTIEIQNRIAGSPSEGNQFVELDTDSNSSMYQDFATVAGTSYRIAFDYSPRPGVAASSNGIEALWNGTLITTIALSGLGLSDTVWSPFGFTAVATGPVSRLAFAAVGTSDSLGGYLDRVSAIAVPVPEPATLPMLGFGLVLLASFSALRRRESTMSF